MKRKRAPGGGRKKAPYKLRTISFKIREEHASRFKELALKLRDEIYNKPE